MKTALIVGLTLVASVAQAAPGFEVIDRGDAIEVVAKDTKATSTTVTTQRERIEVAVAGYPRAAKIAPHDQFVKEVEFEGGKGRRFSVKLTMDRPTVQALAKHALAVQVGNDLHLIFPKLVPAAGKTAVLPEPTLPPELAAKAAQAAPAIQQESAPLVNAPDEIPHATPPVAHVEEKHEEPKHEEPKHDAVAAKAEPKHDEAPAKIGKAKEPGGNKLLMYGIVGLALVGIGSFALKKKKGAAAPNMGIEVIAQKVIGPKAKIVWLSAGQREMIVSVTAQQVRMLGTWKKGETPSVSLPTAHALSDGRVDEKHDLARGSKRNVGGQADAPSSPAIAGLLKLRKQGPEPLVDEDVATGDIDQDAAWAKEIIAATAGMRR
jgi:flagellar biogenesis protein FliO